MKLYQYKLVTIVTEAALELTLSQDIEKLGAHGYTITDARGKGDRGDRNASWNASANIRIEIVCDVTVANAIVEHLYHYYYDNYAMIQYTSDVEVLRSDKF
jgi:nitrogen regulatory protein PII